MLDKLHERETQQRTGHRLVAVAAAVVLILGIGALTHATVTGNVNTGNGQAGLFFFELTASLISGTEVLASSANSLIGNTASRNLAVVGSIDLTGNVAHGKSPLPNCLGVSCG